MNKENNKINNFKYDEISIGDVFEFEEMVGRSRVEDFAVLSGDNNPLHVDKDFGSKSQFGHNIVHGMFLASFFSTLVGTRCPGKNCLYLSQTLNFRQPVFFEEKIIVRGVVKEKNDSIKIIVLKTEIIKDSQIAVSGEAKVKLLK